MGLHFVNITESLKPHTGNTKENKVAFITDKYFLFEEITFPKGSLKASEIESMAQIAIDNLLPARHDEIISGFFVNKNNSSATVFVASKNRILTELPKISNCKYWLPEKFAKSYIKSYSVIKQNVGAEIMDIDSLGKIFINSTKTPLYSKEFWTAELHDKHTKKINKYIETAEFYCNRLWKPAFNVSALATFLLAIALLLYFAATHRISFIEKREPEIQKIISKNRLRNEMLSFVNERSACLKNLVVINDVRPSTLLFSEYSVNGPKITNFVGECDSIATLNQFVKDIKNIGKISVVSTTNIKSTNKGTTFNLDVEFL